MMSDTAGDADWLDKLVLGQLTAAEAERLAFQFAVDPRVTERAEALAQQADPLLDALRHRPEPAAIDADGMGSRLVQRLRASTSVKHFSRSLAAETPLPLPDRLEYFRIIHLLGEGGMGSVYLADDSRLGRLVALKTLRSQVAADPEFKDRFLREARIVARLEHDNIIPIYYVGEANGVPFLTMPFLQGEPLSARLLRATTQNQLLPVAEVVRIAGQIANGLAHAHERGLMHRDIKPANIWLEAPTERVKILDFGLARSCRLSSDRLTSRGVVMGTPAYMAPEQAQDQPVDHRVDLFSLGCVLYEMLTGQCPFSDLEGKTLPTGHATAPPASPSTINPHCPAALAELTLQLLAIAPAHRPASAERVAAELGKIAASLATPDPMTTLSSTSADFAQRDQDRHNPRLRDRVPLLVAVALLVLLPLVGWLASEVLRIDTANGTLVVEMTDDAKVRIQNGELHILDATGQVKYKLKPSENNRFAVAPGDYQIAVAGADGLTLNTNQFEMKQGGEAKVRVTVQPPLATRKEAPPYKNVLGMEFVPVPRGRFRMGGGGGKVGIDVVEIPHDFYLGKYEVTQGQWQAVMMANPSHFSRKGNGKDAVAQVSDEELKEFPVENVSWNHTQEFIRRLSTLDKTPGWRYRLPTEAEWEYACRGAPPFELTPAAEYGYHFYLGQPANRLEPDQANFRGGMRRTCKVGSYPPNRLGLHDMHGNVREWCANEVRGDPKDPKAADQRANRGGSWGNETWECQAAMRSAYLPTNVRNTLGLRLARVPAADADRAAAAWTLYIGGTVRVNDLPRDIHAVAELPREPFRLTYVTLKDNKFVNDAGLAHFQDCPTLGYLSLENTSVTDQGLAHFKACRKLTYLSLKGTKVTAASIATLKKDLPECKIEFE